MSGDCAVILGGLFCTKVFCVISVILLEKLVLLRLEDQLMYSTIIYFGAESLKCGFSVCYFSDSIGKLGSVVI